MDSKPIKVSIIYLTFNGLELVKETLPLLCNTLKTIPVTTEIIVVDNGSQDATCEFVHGIKEIKSFIELKTNLGFAKGCNAGAQKALGEFLFFINNDIKAETDFISPLLELYEKNSNIFAVGPKFLRWDKKTLDDCARFPIFENGLVDVKLDDKDIDSVKQMVFFLGGGFLIKKSLFFEFGCFDEIYTPFSWEDLDLGYRAVKRGYVNLYCPSAVLYHKREATTKTQFSEWYFKSTVWRNKFIFMWSNFTDKKILRKHLTRLPFKLLKFLFNGRWPYVLGFFRALANITAVFKKRKKEIPFFKLSDNHIFLLLSKEECLKDKVVCEKS